MKLGSLFDGSGTCPLAASAVGITECASLQGFEKDWCALVPHKDSAEYKMWGNGMAFPCMLYIMEGVQEILAERYLDNLFGGDTTEP